MHLRPIILVSDSPPEPILQGSRVRVRDLIMHLHAAGRPVHLLFQQIEKVVDPRTIDFFKQYTAAYKITPSAVTHQPFTRAVHSYIVWHLSRHPLGNSLLNIGRVLTGRRRLPFNTVVTSSLTLCSDETKAMLQQMVEGLDPGIIIIDHLYMAECMASLSTSALRVLDTHDVTSLRVERLQAEKLDYAWGITRDDEIRLLKLFDVIIAIQENEAEIFRRMVPDVRVITVGMSFPVHPPTEQPAAGKVMMIGSQVSPNIHGFQTFLNEVWPLVQRACPHATIDVCGKVAYKLKKIAPGIHLRGVVDDLAAAYNTAEVVVNPMWIGTGLKTKTLEALSFSKALVTTPCGVDGMSPSPNTACRITEEYEEMAHSIIELLQTPEKRKALETAAYAYAQQWLSPERVYNQLDQLLQQY